MLFNLPGSLFLGAWSLNPMLVLHTYFRPVLCFILVYCTTAVWQFAINECVMLCYAIFKKILWGKARFYVCVEFALWDVFCIPFERLWFPLLGNISRGLGLLNLHTRSSAPPRTPLLPALQRRGKAEAGPGPSTTRGARKHAGSTSFFRNTVLASRNDWEIIIQPHFRCFYFSCSLAQGPYNGPGPPSTLYLAGPFATPLLGPVCRSQPWIPQKRINRSSCRLDYGLGCNRGSMR